MKLTEHFTLEEFTRSATAARLGIDNSVPPELMDNVIETARMQERIRARLCALAGRDVAMRQTSGYRCRKLNRAVGSNDGSDHELGDAGDWEAPDFGTPTEICVALAPFVDELGIGQLIDEYPDRDGWVHTSRRLVANPVNRIITITGAGTRPGVGP